MYSSTGADKTLTCSDCQQQFEFTASEQQFYTDRGFTEPRRCSSCRASRKAARDGGGSSYGSGSGSSSSYGSDSRGGSGGGYGGGQREMFSRHLLVVRQGSPGSVPAQRLQAGLLQRLLQHAAPLVLISSSRGGSC